MRRGELWRFSVAMERGGGKIKSCAISGKSLWRFAGAALGLVTDRERKYIRWCGGDDDRDNEKAASRNSPNNIVWYLKFFCWNDITEDRVIWTTTRRLLPTVDLRYSGVQESIQEPMLRPCKTTGSPASTIFPNSSGELMLTFLTSRIFGTDPYPSSCASARVSGIGVSDIGVFISCKMTSNLWPSSINLHKSYFSLPLSVHMPSLVQEPMLKHTPPPPHITTRSCRQTTECPTRNGVLSFGNPARTALTVTYWGG